MHCYLCGRAIPSDSAHIRRRVRTGDRSRSSYGSGKVVSAQTSYGMRVVCRRCATFLDRERTQREVIKHLVAVSFLIVVLVGIFLLR